ncbi:hypothetical protein ACWOFR_04275 [Carnobacterium gallinarum]|uniref:ECF-type sigma factor negative effector n=1 Tax=Carnobacterium gallinarum TaxID=2749 RepID=UPI00054D7876|nr:ECF-type sigma factor negative effector [Carnobacterium gallinarum]
MTNLKSSKKIDELAEKIALEDFDNIEKNHEFSDTYQQKRKVFMRDIRKNSQSKIKHNKKKMISVAAAILFIAIPTTVFAATKIYDSVVKQQKYETRISLINKDDKKINKEYQLVIADLPENMEAMNNESLKYSFKDNYGKGGFSFLLWRVGKKNEFIAENTKDYVEKEINGKKAIIVNVDNGIEKLSFNKHIYLVFEEEGIVVESYVGSDVSDEQMMAVLGSISFKPTTKEVASYIRDYDSERSTNQIPASVADRKIVPLEKESKKLFKVGQKIPITTFEGSKLDYTIEKVEVFDSLVNFKEESFNPFILERLNEANAMDQAKNLIPYQRSEFKAGDGKNTINELTNKTLIKPKFVFITTSVKNMKTKATEEIYMTPSLEILKSEKNGWTFAQKNGTFENGIKTGEVDYLEPAGEGKAFYNIGRLAPGKTITIKLGYLVDEDKLDSMFIDAFNNQGMDDKKEDLNAEKYTWIDIRQ